MIQECFLMLPMIGPVFLEVPVYFTLLPLNQRQEKINSLEPERLLVNKAYSPYRPKTAGRDSGKLPPNF